MIKSAQTIKIVGVFVIEGTAFTAIGQLFIPTMSLPPGLYETDCMKLKIIAYRLQETKHTQEKKAGKKIAYSHQPCSE